MLLAKKLDYPIQDSMINQRFKIPTDVPLFISLSNFNDRFYQLFFSIKQLVFQINLITENQVWDDFVWTNSNFIKEAFVKNSVTDRTLKTQYIATNTGLTRIYPSRKWHMEPESVTVDLFDPRYRPWFIAAQSAPKDVLFLIDMSGSVKGQTIHLIRMTILHILTTLGPNDYMNAIWFNTRREFALRGCSNGFIPATTLNKKILREHLEHLEERDQANLTPALELSFKIFSEGRLNVSKFWEFNNAEHSSGGHKLIMLFTDFDEEHPASVFENYNPTLPNNPIKIFGFSMGFGTGPLSVLNYLACRTNGGHFVVDSVSDVRHQAINYLTKLSELLHNAFSEKPLFLRPISWSNLMMDVQGGGPVITLSLPIFSQVRNRSQVAAVAGLDIELKQLVKVLPNNDQIYAFIIDNNGIVIYHPKLKLPTELALNYGTCVHCLNIALALLQQTELYAIRRTACFDRRSRQRATSKIQFTQTDETVLKLMGLFDSIPTYDIKDFERNSNKFFEFRTAMIDRNCSEESIVDNDREYFCVPVDGTPLVVGFVFFPKNTAVTLESDFKKPKYFTSSLVGYLITDQRICEGAINQYNVNERFDVLMGSSFCDKDLNHMNAIVAASKRWIQHWPKLESNSTCASTPLPNGFDAFYHILSFIHTPTGFTAFYPNCSTKPIHSALETFQHRQSSIDGNANKLHIFPTFLTPTTLVVHKNIYDSTYNKHLATVGEQKRCHIVTETGHIVAGFSANRHLTSVDIFVFHELIKKSYATKWTVLDPQSHCSPLRWYFYPSNAAAPRPHSLITILFRLTKLLTSTFWIELVLVLKTAIRYVQTQPLPMEDRCVYSETSHDELCTMEYPNYAIRINTTQYFYVNTGKCMRDVRIFPIPDTSLYLFVMQKPCENETVPESLRKQNRIHRAHPPPN
uniref:VWFA domain-containing protein n=1 Tax=Syphacia muris TaxID=451379 RepID=A0A0N5AWD2_9BILA